MNKSNVSIRDVHVGNLRKQFNLFFIRSKQALLNTYLADAYKRNTVAYEWVRRAFGMQSTVRRASVKHNLRQHLFSSDRYINKRRCGQNYLRTLPSFISLLFRVCYVIKQKADNIRAECTHKQVNEEALFSFLFSRLHVF